MQRTNQSFEVKDIEQFKINILNWAQKFKNVVWLDSNNYQQKHSSFDAVLAVDAVSEIKTNYSNAFSELKKYQTKIDDYIFGYLSYDLKNDVENLTSNNFDRLHFPDLYFFQPKKLFFLKGNTVEVNFISTFKHEIEIDLNEINSIKTSSKRSNSNENIKIKLRIHKDEYYSKLNSVLNHIYRGNIYEANFCQEFYSENSTINPVETYKQLNHIEKDRYVD